MIHIKTRCRDVIRSIPPIIIDKEQKTPKVKKNELYYTINDNVIDKDQIVLIIKI